MECSDFLFTRELLANLKTEIFEAGYIRCPKTWRNIDYVPDFNKFYLIENGEGWLRIENKDYYPQSGEMFLLPHGVKQSYSYTNTDNTFLKYWVHFTATVGGSNLFDIIQLPFLTIPKGKLAFQLFRKLLDYCNDNESVTSRLQANAALYELIAVYITQAARERLQIRRISDTARLSPVLQYINEHLTETISINQLAAEAFMHPNYFIRLFKNKMGISPIHYINRKRMESAKLLLKTSGMPVNKVAEISGFNNFTYFCNLFKKQTGVTPSEYRISRLTTYNSHILRDE